MDIGSPPPLDFHNHCELYIGQLVKGKIHACVRGEECPACKATQTGAPLTFVAISDRSYSHYHQADKVRLTSSRHPKRRRSSSTTHVMDRKSQSYRVRRPTESNSNGQRSGSSHAPTKGKQRLICCSRESNQEEGRYHLECDRCSRELTGKPLTRKTSRSPTRTSRVLQDCSMRSAGSDSSPSLKNASLRCSNERLPVVHQKNGCH